MISTVSYPPLLFDDFCYDHVFAFFDFYSLGNILSLKTLLQTPTPYVQILRAKEVSIPEECSSEEDSDGISEHDDQSVETNKENEENLNISDINAELRSEQMTHIKPKIKRNSDPTTRNIPWIARRKKGLLLV